MSGAQAEVGSTANNYEILSKLAEGGMAELFLARHTNAGVARHVVLKRVLRERATDARFVQMFLDEARLAAQLQHPNVAQVYDIGMLGDSIFFTMEYVHGESVRALLGRAKGLGRPLSISVVLTIAAGAAAGLHHAHELVGADGRPLGIVHRDVSPSNLMVGYEGHVKLVDFGVAKATDRVQETRSGTVKGKISYLSPEQCRGAPVDRRTDLYALGIVIWEMLATDRLYRRESDYENMVAIVQGDVTLPSELRTDVVPEVDGLVMKLLAKNPDDRFETAEQVLEEIERIAGKMGCALSAAAVSRFVRELFGQRPLPWLEAHDKPVTVTSEPIPFDLIAPPPGDVDRLAGFRAAFAFDHPDGRRTPPVSSLTAPGGRASVPTPTPGSLRVPRPPTEATKNDLPFGAPRAIERSTTFMLKRRIPSWVIAGAIGLLVAVAVIVVVLSRGGRGEKLAIVDAAPAIVPDAAVAVVVDAAPPPIDPEVELTAAIAARRYPDVVTACGDATLEAKHAADCAIAACRTRDLVRARKWAQGITGSKRTPIAGACLAVKLVLDPSIKRPTVDCTKDPLACPR